MKYSGKPFLSAKGYAFFLEDWCYGCTHYKAREDGFPEFPENGGCPVLGICGETMCECVTNIIAWLRNENVLYTMAIGQH